MNCKPGDLAVVVSTLGWPGLEKALGCVVQVIRSSEMRHPFGTMWDVEHRDIRRAADACLRPIRPGDISDEEVRALYAPKVPEAA
jgi:hypothetical protein